MIDKQTLIDFRDLKITKNELENQIGKRAFRSSFNSPIKINTNHVINLLKAFQENIININTLLEWVNTIWFSDLYTYEDIYCDSIASVMNKLEELDERSNTIGIKDIEHYIQALETNTEV